MENKYLSLCNWHQSIHGDSVALFEGSDFGKSKGGYTSNIKHAYLFDKNVRDGDNCVMVEINDLGMTIEDFDRFRYQLFPQHILKDTIINMARIPHNIVYKFENERDEELACERKYGYCSENGSMCDGEECESYQLCSIEENNECIYNIGWTYNE